VSESIEYVGGQPEGQAKRPWPYLFGGLAALVGIGLLVLAWPAIQGGGRALSEQVLPYNVNIKGSWSNADLVAGGPVDLLLTVQNADSRTIQGITIRLKGLKPGFQVLGATPDANVSGPDVFFRDQLRPGRSESITIKLLPVESGNFNIPFSLSAGRSTQPMHLHTSDNSVTLGLVAPAAVRDATPADNAIQVQVQSTSALAVGDQGTVAVRLQNAGALRITSVTLNFPDLPSSFELSSTTPAGDLASDGKSVRFATQLDPGDQTDVTVHFIAHKPGTFHVSTQFFLSDEPIPVQLANGDRALSFDVSVTAG
jgi:hypothetical protein